MLHQPKSLIIVENLTMPLDRRVWQEARALRDAGHVVSVICPKAPGFEAAYELLEGIHVFRHPLPSEADSAMGYLVEYSAALFWEFVLSIRVARTVGFDTVQACNPPDLMFVVAAFWKYLFGKPFIFDHHDINPELYEAKFGRRGLFHRLLLMLEHMTFRVADVSIATNETFRDIATGRGGMSEDRVFVVRSVPDMTGKGRTTPRASLRNGRRFVAGYVGIMGAQDGVDGLVRAMAELVHGQGRRDVQAVIVGGGTELPHLKALSTALGLSDYITFTGFVPSADLPAIMSTFDVGVVPDPKNPFNAAISMNKVFDYLAYGLPMVMFDLAESRRTAAGAAYVAGGERPRDLADALATVLDNDAQRAEMAAASVERARSVICWDRERAQLLAAYARAGRASTQVQGVPHAASAR